MTDPDLTEASCAVPAEKARVGEIGPEPINTDDLPVKEFPRA